MRILFFFHVLCTITSIQSSMLPLKGRALEIVLSHVPEMFDHAMISSLAIDTEYKKVLEQTAPLRKNRLIQALRQHNLYNDDLVWYTFGSACGNSMVIEKRSSPEICTNALQLQMFSLGEGNVKVISQEIGRFDTYISYAPKVRFTDQGDLYMYGCRLDLDVWNDSSWYGKTQVKKDQTDAISHFHNCLAIQNHLFKYCLSKDGSTNEFRCGLAIMTVRGYANTYSLSRVVPFPVLLGALLQSGVKSKDQHGVLYSLDHAIIPDNYKATATSGPSFPFGGLEGQLQGSIRNRYECCKKIKSYE